MQSRPIELAGNGELTQRISIKYAIFAAVLCAAGIGRAVNAHEEPQNALCRHIINGIITTTVKNYNNYYNGKKSESTLCAVTHRSLAYRRSAHSIV